MSGELGAAPPPSRLDGTTVPSKEQDRTATYIALYMTSAVCAIVLALMAELRSWVSLILLVNALLYLNLGGVVAGSTARRVRYLDPAFPKRNMLTLFLVGALQVVHWRTCSHLFYHTHVKLWLLDAVEATCVTLYFLYVLWRARSPRFNIRILGGFLLVSMLAVSTAATYKHATRKMQHTHIRNDWRLLYVCIVQLVHATLLFFGTRRFQAWFLQAVAMPFYILLGVCAGHRRFKF
ncbi:hypothetical protein PTSG_07051 [Salpingoeca rosetta]|uniref:Uncharacterized protein n=1 Tax=Salpingoeca rosetta (strain ATCC 50818 / BSB-021) TaxID=946362 RepID=F2UDW8_SALR5|nr:uncharacterized protein PTSG_07051 [Salpingoeca rosetta]EGD74818.1 hypothetical protein PTSG_07051 [Salpingoeca rosetta]|eukprot:XP_004992463.1 hypothetical protein PTSG_07051 [Salpingoeca rosetta]